MTLKKSALFGVLLARALIGQQAYAQPTTPPKATPVLVPMPKDIQCELSGMSSRSVVGANAQLTETSGSVDGVTCWITGKTPEQKKEVSLASNGITRGMLTTKDFGKWKVTPQNSMSSSGLSIAIRRDKLPSFRAFLQKGQAETSVEPASKAKVAETSASSYVSVKANCVVYHTGYRGIVVAPGVSEPSGTVARLECNGKDVEIASSEMANGVIITKEYGKVKVHFGSMVATVGAGDFTSTGGNTVPERAIDIAVQKSAVARFMAQFP